MKPCEVNKSNENDVLHKLFLTKNKPKPKIKFSVGDRVRIKAYKKTFGNKYSNNWTREIFIIKEILNTNPITYKIIDLNNEEIEGSFYNEELQKIKILNIIFNKNYSIKNNKCKKIIWNIING
uniref:Chromo domain-containing protein n=1 Tax=Schizaphis graminum TaxID=13262 RepID=A0A2S2NKI3_SCHGA